MMNKSWVPSSVLLVLAHSALIATSWYAPCASTPHCTPHSLHPREGRGPGWVLSGHPFSSIVSLFSHLLSPMGILYMCISFLRPSKNSRLALKQCSSAGPLYIAGSCQCLHPCLYLTRISSRTPVFVLPVLQCLWWPQTVEEQDREGCSNLDKREGYFSLVLT